MPELSATSLLSDFETVGRQLAAQGPDWLRALRNEGRKRFETLGLPDPRQESWRGTSLATIARTRFEPAGPATSADLPALGRIEMGGPRLVFDDGRFTPRFSTSGDPERGVWVGSLAEALEQIPDRLQPLLTRHEAGPTAALPALNGALFEDGAVVLVPDDVILEAPVQLIFRAGGSETTANHPRTLIVAGRGSQVTVVEIYVGEDTDTYLTNAVSEVVVGENASVVHYRILRESEQAYHLSSSSSHQERNGRYTSYNIDLGGKLVRHDTRAVLAGEGGDCELLGLYLTRDGQHVDHHTVLDHARPGCNSRELYKGILCGRSRSVFCGRIIVREGAQKTNAKQSNPNLLLSDEALAHTRPQLEIYADDVKCTHGATIGRMSEDAIFYLRSRGIDAKEARAMLIGAFAAEVLARIPIVPLREVLLEEVAARLPGAGTR